MISAVKAKKHLGQHFLLNVENKKLPSFNIHVYFILCVLFFFAASFIAETLSFKEYQLLTTCSTEVADLS